VRIKQLLDLGVVQMKLAYVLGHSIQRLSLFAAHFPVINTFVGELGILNRQLILFVEFNFMFMFEVDEQVAFKLKLEATISMHTIINHAVEVIEHSPQINAAFRLRLYSCGLFDQFVGVAF